MKKSITRNLLAGTKKMIKAMYSRLYILNDTCDTCTVNNFIKAVYENKPRSIVEKGFVLNSTLIDGLEKLTNEYHEKSNNGQADLIGKTQNEITKINAVLDTLTIALSLVVFGNCEKVLEYLKTHFRITKKMPENEAELESLAKTIEQLINVRKIKLKEDEKKLSGLIKSKKTEKSPREIFIESITAFKQGLELPYNASLDITLTEYIIYSKRYDALVKKLSQQKNKKYGYK